MKFQVKKKRFFENALARLLLHLVVTLTGIMAVFFAISGSSWLPIVGFAIFMAFLEGVFWYDRVYGWPIKESKRSVG